MLLAILQMVTWPFGRKRLWLTAPIVLGFASIISGMTLLWPFIQGYRELETISVSSIDSCAKNIDVFIAPMESGKFIIALSPMNENLKIEDITNFKLLSDRNQISDGKINLVDFGARCERMSVDFEARQGVKIELLGAMFANRFVGNFVEHDRALGLRSKTPVVGYVVKDRETATPAKLANSAWTVEQIRSDLASHGVKAGFAYELSGPGNRSLFYTSTVTADQASADLPAFMFENKPMEDLLNVPDRDVPIGVSGLVFAVQCPTCVGRGGWGSQIGLAISHSDSEIGLAIGDSEGDLKNRIVAVSGDRWRAKLLDQLHASRAQIGDTWLSTGAQANEAQAISYDSETVDGFRWERFDWLSKEQAITLFASLLLGLGVTLWVEVLIVFLHSVSPPDEKAEALKSSGQRSNAKRKLPKFSALKRRPRLRSSRSKR